MTSEKWQSHLVIMHKVKYILLKHLTDNWRFWRGLPHTRSHLIFGLMRFISHWVTQHNTNKWYKKI